MVAVAAIGSFEVAVDVLLHLYDPRPPFARPGSRSMIRRSSKSAIMPSWGSVSGRPVILPYRAAAVSMQKECQP